MAMRFDPRNKVVQVCLKGILAEESGDKDLAMIQFLAALEAATNDFERFLTTFFIGRLQEEIDEKLKWFDQSLAFAYSSDDNSALTALPTLYGALSACYKALGNQEKAHEADEKANRLKNQCMDQGPFFHGTKASLQVGDQLVAGNASNYKEDLIMNHIYFTANVSGAGLAASLAKGDGEERVYVVKPLGPYENDPNVTDKKFPGNLTRSYRSTEPLLIIGIVEDWDKQTPESIEAWRKKLADQEGAIINE